MLCLEKFFNSLSLKSQKHVHGQATAADPQADSFCLTMKYPLKSILANENWASHSQLLSPCVS